MTDVPPVVLSPVPELPVAEDPPLLDEDAELEPPVAPELAPVEEVEVVEVDVAGEGVAWPSVGTVIGGAPFVLVLPELPLPQAASETDASSAAAPATIGLRCRNSRTLI